MNRKWVGVATAGLMVLGLGCTSMVTVQSKGTQKTEAPIPPHVTYALFPTSEVEKDPAFAQYSRLVAEKMNERGYKETESKIAQLGVYLAYGVTQSSSGLGSSSPPPPTGGAGGMGSGGGYGGSGGGGGGYMGSVSSSDPSMARRVTSQMVIIVGDLPKSRAAGQLVELWRGETTHTGHTNELPQLAPLLVDATFRHFGESTPAPVDHTFGEEEIKKLRDHK
jgi:Domain of unknown function (DUF4136)